MKIIILLVLMMTGCAGSVERVRTQANNAYKLAKDGSGTFYGVVGYEEVTVKDACDAVRNNDERCLEQHKYKSRIVSPAIGFSAGVAAITVLIPKEIVIKSCNRPAWEKCDFVKVKAAPNRLGTLLELTTNNCNWSGFNGAGGVVCPSLNWDYKKDLNEWDTVGGRVYVKEQK